MRTKAVSGAIRSAQNSTNLNDLTLVYECSLQMPIYRPVTISMGNSDVNTVVVVPGILMYPVNFSRGNTKNLASQRGPDIYPVMSRSFSLRTNE